MIVINKTVLITGNHFCVDYSLWKYLCRFRNHHNKLFISFQNPLLSDMFPHSHFIEFINNCESMEIHQLEYDSNNFSDNPDTQTIHLPHKQFLQYTLDRIFKRVNVEDDVLNAGDFPKLATTDDIIKLYGDKPGSRKKTVSLVSGSFDLIHLGHVWHINAAKRAGDIVVAAAMSTKSIKAQEKNSDGSRPIYSESDRVGLLSALRDVHHIVMFDELDCRKVLEDLKPNFFIKHKKDMERNIVKEECQIVRDLGGEIVVNNDDVGYSSTKIINYIKNKFKGKDPDAFFNL